MKSMLVDGEKTSLQIWDTAGQERSKKRRRTAAGGADYATFHQSDGCSFYRFRSIARSYFRKAHGVLLLYDVTSESSFLSVRAWVDQVQVTV